MTTSPDDWKRLGLLFQDARHRLGMSRATFSELAGISEKAVYNAESGDEHKKVPPTYAKYAAALKWTPDSIRMVLAGGDPVIVGGPARQASPAAAAPPAQTPEEPILLDLLTHVHEFGRLAVSLGGDSNVRDELDATARRLVRSIPRGVTSQDNRRRNDAPADGDTDTERVLRAMESDA